MTSRFVSCVLLFVLGCVALLPAARAEKPVNTTFTGVAIRGYDPVAYFTTGKPAEGSDEFTFSWNGAEWRFASQAHLDLFKAAPEKYAPQYGGYCSWAVSQGYTANIDPQAWRIVEGKLYLNYSPKVQAKWEQDIPGLIAKANQNWPELLKK